MTATITLGILNAEGAQRLGRAARSVWVTAIPTLMFLAVAIFGPLFIRFDPTHVVLEDRLLPPGSPLSEGGVALFGTDAAGHDVLTQMVIGARVTLTVALLVVSISLVVGTIVGLVAAYFGGRVDAVFMRIADIQLALPDLIFAILIASVLGPSILNVVIALTLARWVTFARVVRSSALKVKEFEFVQSARVLGASSIRILVRHILPSITGPIVVLTAVSAGSVMVSEAALSFIGLGSPPDQPSWGLIIANGRDYLSQAWWITTLPGVALIAVVVSLGSLGDRLRDRLDPYTVN